EGNLAGVPRHPRANPLAVSGSVNSPASIPNVRFGSLADCEAPIRNVRLLAENGRAECQQSMSANCHKRCSFGGRLLIDALGFLHPPLGTKAVNRHELLAVRRHHLVDRVAGLALAAAMDTDRLSRGYP